MQNWRMNPTLDRSVLQRAGWSQEASGDLWGQNLQQTARANRPLTVVMVAACPLPSTRGTSIRILRMAEALSERGHNVHIVTYHLEQSEVSPACVIQCRARPSLKVAFCSPCTNSLQTGRVGSRLARRGMRAA
jgi:hypothetical protein